VLVLVFGLYLLGVFNLRAFSQERRIHVTDKPLGYLGTLFVGFAFGAGWTPCIGPILGSILTYAATQAQVSRGVCCSAPTRSDSRCRSSSPRSRRVVPHGVRRDSATHGLDHANLGAVLVVVAVLMIADYMPILTGFLQRLTPVALKNRL
jgi:cytochrome c-type biogenesis protein